ncbi:MAG: ATP-binding protein [Rhodospirillaceae bacterium]|nr:ATP-binding protein [Rhodospirillaceae bacterium]
MPKDWRFYGRTAEIAAIKRILGRQRWFFCRISGRRRIGKTTLIQKALDEAGRRNLYFQVPDSDEYGVVQAFLDAVEDFYDPDDEDHRQLVGGLRKETKSLLDVAGVISTFNQNGIIVTIDEFQYFHRKALSPFCSFLQREVDVLRDTDNGGLFVLGSIHTEMTALLEDRHSPLFGRNTDTLEIDHWDFSTAFEMFREHKIDDPYHQLFLWTLFEGVPKFYRDCFEQGVLEPRDDHRQETLRRLFFEPPSPLRDEAANWFLRELRGRYDSLLKALAKREPCSHGELMAEFGEGEQKQLGGYLKILIEKYRMVDRLKPVFAADAQRNSRYMITDNFLTAWLSAIDRYVQQSRVQPVERVVPRADERLREVEGFSFERMIRKLLEECSRKELGDFPITDLIRGYWNKPDGSDIEIDVVAMNSEKRMVRFGSCKRSDTKHENAAIQMFKLHVDRFLETQEGRRLTEWENSTLSMRQLLMLTAERTWRGRGTCVTT